MNIVRTELLMAAAGGGPELPSHLVPPAASFDVPVQGIIGDVLVISLLANLGRALIMALG